MMKLQLKHQPVITNIIAADKPWNWFFSWSTFQSNRLCFEACNLIFGWLQKESFVKTFKCFEKCLSFGECPPVSSKFFALPGRINDLQFSQVLSHVFPQTGHTQSRRRTSWTAPLQKCRFEFQKQDLKGTERKKAYAIGGKTINWDIVRGQVDERCLRTLRAAGLQRFVLNTFELRPFLV